MSVQISCHPYNLTSWHSRKVRPWARMLSLLITLSFAWPYLSWAFESSNYLIPPQGLSQVNFQGKPLNLPSNLCRVHEIAPGKDRLVIHIQDLHCNYEIQMNEARIIDYLAREYGLKLVGQEGASGTVNVSKFKTFPDGEAVREVGDYFVRQGKLTGAEYYAATGRNPIRIEGIETRDLYQANFKLVNFFLTLENRGYCDDLRTLLDETKNRVYAPSLRAFDARREAYRQGRMDLLQYAAFLRAAAGQSRVDTAPFRNLARYLRVGQSAFSPEIDPDRLFDEVEALDAAIRRALYRDPAEQELDDWYRRLDIIERLINISASPRDVLDFRRERALFAVAHFADFFRSQGVDTVLELDPEVYQLDGAIGAAEEFYRLTDERSVHFVDNLLRKMDRRGERLAVMLTGGFHTQGVLEELRRRGVTCLSVTPRLTRHDVVNPYFSLLQNKRSPLETLLAQNQNIFALPTLCADGSFEPGQRVTKNQLERPEQRIFSDLAEQLLRIVSLARRWRQGMGLEQLSRADAELARSYPGAELLRKVPPLSLAEENRESGRVLAAAQTEFLVLPTQVRAAAGPVRAVTPRTAASVANLARPQDLEHMNVGGYPYFFIAPQKLAAALADMARASRQGGWSQLVQSLRQAVSGRAQNLLASLRPLTTAVSAVQAILPSTLALGDERVRGVAPALRGVLEPGIGGVMPFLKAWWVNRGNPSEAVRARREAAYDARTAWWLEFLMSTPAGAAIWFLMWRDGYLEGLSPGTRQLAWLVPAAQFFFLCATAGLVLFTGNPAWLRIGLSSIWGAFAGYHFLEGPRRARAPTRNRVLAMLLAVGNVAFLVLLPASCPWLAVVLAGIGMGLLSHGAVNLAAGAVQTLRVWRGSYRARRLQGMLEKPVEGLPDLARLLAQRQYARANEVLLQAVAQLGTADWEDARGWKDLVLPWLERLQAERRLPADLRIWLEGMHEGRPLVWVFSQLDQIASLLGHVSNVSEEQARDSAARWLDSVEWEGEAASPRRVAGRYRILKQQSPSPESGITAFEAWDEISQRRVALKLSPPHSSVLLVREYLILQRLGTLNEIDGGRLETPYGEMVFIAEDWLGFLSLQHAWYFWGFHAQDLPYLAYGLLWELARAHDRRIIHNDLKPSNILIPVGQDYPPGDPRYWARPSLIDWSIAAQLPLGREYLLSPIPFGTPGWRAPESEINAGHSMAVVSAKSDLYVLGLVLYSALHSSSGLAISPELEEFLRTLTARDPEQRYATARDALAALERIKPDLRAFRPDWAAAEPSFGGVLPFVKAWWANRGNPDEATRARREADYDTRTAWWLENGLLYGVSAIPVLIGILGFGLPFLATAGAGYALVWALFAPLHYLDTSAGTATAGQRRAAWVIAGINLILVPAMLLAPWAIWPVLGASFIVHGIVNRYLAPALTKPGEVNSRNLDRQWQALGQRDFPRDESGNYRPFTREEILARMRRKASEIARTLPAGGPEASAFDEYVEKLAPAVWDAEAGKMAYSERRSLVDNGEDARNPSVQDLERAGRALPYFAFLSEWRPVPGSAAGPGQPPRLEPRFPGARDLCLARAAGSVYETKYYSHLLSGEAATSSPRMITVSRHSLEDIANSLKNMAEAAARASGNYAAYAREILARLDAAYRQDPRMRQAADRLAQQLRASGVLEGATRFRILDEAGIGSYSWFLIFVLRRYFPGSEARTYVGNSGLSGRYNEESVPPLFFLERARIPDVPEMNPDELNAAFGLNVTQALEIIYAVGSLAATLPQPVRVDPEKIDRLLQGFSPATPEVRLGSFLRSLFIYNGAVEFRSRYPRFSDPGAATAAGKAQPGSLEPGTHVLQRNFRLDVLPGVRSGLLFLLGAGFVFVRAAAALGGASRVSVPTAAELRQNNRLQDLLRAHFPEKDFTVGRFSPDRVEIRVLTPAVGFFHYAQGLLGGYYAEEAQDGVNQPVIYVPAGVLAWFERGARETRAQVPNAAERLLARLAEARLAQIVEQQSLRYYGQTRFALLLQRLGLDVFAIMGSAAARWEKLPRGATPSEYFRQTSSELAVGGDALALLFDSYLQEAAALLPGLEYQSFSRNVDSRLTQLHRDGARVNLQTVLDALPDSGRYLGALWRDAEALEPESRALMLNNIMDVLVRQQDLSGRSPDDWARAARRGAPAGDSRRKLSVLALPGAARAMHAQVGRVLEALRAEPGTANTAGLIARLEALDRVLAQAAKSEPGRVVGADQEAAPVLAAEIERALNRDAPSVWRLGEEFRERVTGLAVPRWPTVDVDGKTVAWRSVMLAVHESSLTSLIGAVLQGRRLRRAELTRFDGRGDAIPQNLSAAPLGYASRFRLLLARLMPQVVANRLHAIVAQQQALAYLAWLVSNLGEVRNSPLARALATPGTPVWKAYVRLALAASADRRRLARLQLDFGLTLFQFMRNHEEFTEAEQVANLACYARLLGRMQCLPTAAIGAQQSALVPAAWRTSEPFRVPAVLLSPGHSGPLGTVADFLERFHYALDNRVLQRFLRKGFWHSFSGAA